MLLSGRSSGDVPGERRRALVDPLEVSERRVHALGDLRAAAGDVARAVLEPCLAEMERRSEERYAEVTRRFRELAGTLPVRLVESVPDAVPRPLREDPAETLPAPRRLYFMALMHYHYPASPWWHLWRRIMPAGMRRRRDRKAAEAYLLHLLEVNSARVEGDLNDRVTESRLAREAGQLAVAAEVERIDRLLERLQAILPRAGQAA